MIAANAKYSISVNQTLRDVIEQNSRIAGLINNLNEQAAERKMVSVLFLSLGTALRKSLTDKFSQMRVATISFREIRENCEQAFRKKRNRTLERYKFFSRKQTQKDAETILAYINSHGGQMRFWRSNRKLDYGYFYPEHE